MVCCRLILGFVSQKMRKSRGGGGPLFLCFIAFLVFVSHLERGAIHSGVPGNPEKDAGDPLGVDIFERGSQKWSKTDPKHLNLSFFKTLIHFFRFKSNLGVPTQLPALLFVIEPR